MTTIFYIYHELKEHQISNYKYNDIFQTFQQITIMGSKLAIILTLSAFQRIIVFEEKPSNRKPVNERVLVGIYLKTPI